MYKSKAQQGYMHVHHPELAKEFDAKTPKSKFKKLPEHVKKKKGAKK